MNPTLDPWIEGYLEYKLKVRRLAPRSIVDIRCSLKRAHQKLGAIRRECRSGSLSWRIICSGLTRRGRRAIPTNL